MKKYIKDGRLKFANLKYLFYSFLLVVIKV